MKLVKLTLLNFKGIRNFTLDTHGDNANVYGDNGTGKTTLFDSLQWLLFGKDSTGKECSVKPLREDGSEIHHLDTEVEGIFELDGRTVTLKKVFHEKWTKKRGSATQEFSGHTTDYAIDGVPRPKKEYDSFIAGIANENVFRLVTNPAYFNEQLEWQDRRKILMTICGDISDTDVIAADPELAELPHILQGQSLEDRRKVIQARQTAINKELKEIPARIDEVQRGLPDVNGIGARTAIETEIASLKKQRDTKQAEIIRVQNGGEVAEQQNQLREVEGRIIDIQNKYRADTQDRNLAKKAKVQELTMRARQGNAAITERQQMIERNQNEIKNNMANCDSLRADWYDVSKKEFAYQGETVCPTCGQDLPADQIEQAREKALADFNLKKSQQLENINRTGKTTKQATEALEAKNATLTDEIAKLTDEKNRIEQEAAALQAEIDNATPQDHEALESRADYKAAMKEKGNILKHIDDLKAQAQTVLQGIRDEVNVLSQDISAREHNLSLLDARKNSLDRITELETQEKTLAAEYETLQGQLYVTDQFVKDKVKLLESKINAKFKMARFKLFDTQVNGGLVECCKTTYKGVPYGSGLNNAARINVGLDIINTLSEYYGFTAPIFVDNAEAVTELTSTDSQVIRLVVSGKDKPLRVEAEESNSLF